MNRESCVRELMSRPVRRLSVNTRVRDAAEFLRRWGVSGAPVMDVQGRPTGVFSLSDLATHVSQRMLDVPAIDPANVRALETGESISLERGFHVEAFDDARVSDLMTPIIICVDPDAPIREAIRKMRTHSVHRVFVKKANGPLEGVITTMDVLRWVGDLAEPSRERKVG